jgi:hypothetical protein
MEGAERGNGLPDQLSRYRQAIDDLAAAPISILPGEPLLFSSLYIP